MRRSNLTFSWVLLLVTGGCSAESIGSMGGAQGGGGSTTSDTTTGGSSTTSGTPTGATSGGGSSTTNMTSGAGGSTSTSTTSGNAGSTNTTSAGGSAGTGGSGGASAGSGGTAGSGGSSASDAGPGDASVGGNPITKVVPTAGCGKPAGAMGPGTIDTMGSKPAGCADSKCGAWMYTRDYIVTLPTGYDMNKAYPLVFEGPGCGGSAAEVYPLTFNGAGNVGNTVIRVGLTPPPSAIGHATNPGQGCFDDHEGDDSVDWVFYENVYDKLAGLLCFDRNRVFSAGNSTGSWFSNELACKYAGDATRPVRAPMPNTGGLPTSPAWVPTCTKKPMAGMWIDEINNLTFAGNKVAIARAMSVNGCTIGTGYDDAMFDNFAIGGGNPDTTCKKIRGCPELFPLVVCALPGSAQSSHDSVANPGFSTFIKLFSAGSFLTP